MKEEPREAEVWEEAPLDCLREAIVEPFVVVEVAIDGILCLSSLGIENVGKSEVDGEKEKEEASSDFRSFQDDKPRIA